MLRNKKANSKVYLWTGESQKHVSAVRGGRKRWNYQRGRERREIKQTPTEGGRRKVW